MNPEAKGPSGGGPEPERGEDERRSGARGFLIGLAWTLAIAWSVYLVSDQREGGGDVFAVIIQVMGSIGILYAIFLVTRPQQRRMARAIIGPDDLAADRRRDDSSAAARWAIVTITLALAIGGIAYRLMQDNYMHQSAVFFIGIPAVLAITLALTPQANSATGMIIKGLTLALLLSGVVFFEGVICILMAAPLFYLVGLVIGIPIDRARRKRRREGRVYSVVGVALLILSLEGVTPGTSFSTHEVVSVTRTIEAPVALVRKTLGSTPEFDKSLPFYLRLGFPRPVGARGSGLRVGDTRTIFFGEESPMEPMNASHEHHHDAAPPGALVLEIVRSEEGVVVFKPTEDATAFTHWITWGRSVVEWRALDRDTTEVTWTMHFERRLSPSWYFAPWQRYAAERATGYLIDTVVTP